jgi:hypothetical protein
LPVFPCGFDLSVAGFRRDSLVVIVSTNLSLDETALKVTEGSHSIRSDMITLHHDHDDDDTKQADQQASERAYDVKTLQGRLSLQQTERRGDSNGQCNAM